MALLAIIWAYKQYTELLVGTIVGKYKGDEYLHGFVVVEAVKKYTDGSMSVQKRKVQRTYKVPFEYFNKTKIGDEGLFPF